ncbi:MAG: hypothetical protein GY703_02915 [Gammaproteobacteria bacterium]|nr:hypothetical protein [Gammaproteobacteria bacterium]
MDMDDNQNGVQIAPPSMVRMVPFLVLILFGIGIYYFHSLEHIAERLTESEQTMKMADSIRHTLKVSILNLRASEAYLTALSTEDEELVNDALNYMEASLGFIFSEYVDVEPLADRVVPLIRENIHLIETQGLAATDERMQKLQQNLNTLYREVAQREMSIWITLQEDFIQFQSNEYRLQLVYQFVAAIALVF